MYLKGTTTDAATTFVLGQPSSQQKKFLDVGKKALRKAINKARINARVKDISQVLQTTVEAAGYTVSRTLTGHGLGETMHEDPPIPCFVSSDPAINTRLKENMILAIEIMYMAGDWPLVIDQDGWTLYTKDGSDSAVFEEDVLITADGPEVITNPSLLEPEGKV
jgi:methionyl aminopeptidase